MREIGGDVFQGRFHNLLISKNNTFWVPQISRITFQVVLVDESSEGLRRFGALASGFGRLERPLRGDAGIVGPPDMDEEAEKHQRDHEESVK
jgi:hypothetical protein